MSNSNSRIDWAKWFPPLTAKTFISHYLPASGAVSHTLYTVHIFSPNLISKLFPTGDLAVSNTILFNANVGLGFYVYFRRHLHRLKPWERVEMSVIASSLFNFGSILAAVLIKALFPPKSDTGLKTIAATSLSVYFLTRAHKYFDIFDLRGSRSSVSPSRSVSSRKRGKRRSVASSVAEASEYDGDDKFSIGGSTNLNDELISQDQSFITPEKTNNGYMPLTPSATLTQHSQAGDDDGMMREASANNYRYLHSYALSNLNESRPLKENIIRRANINGKPKVGRRLSTTKMMTEPKANYCFVTPEPSLREEELGIYTPPQSRMDTPKRVEKSKRCLRKNVVEEDDWDEKIDKVLDMVQWHAPVAMVPLVFTCFVTETNPLLNPLRFLFVR